MDEKSIKSEILSTSSDERRIYKSRIQKFKKSHFHYVVLLSSIAALQFIAIAFFTRGFLLTRHVLNDLTPPFNNTHTPYEAEFNKAVILIVDALRFDFVIPVESDTANQYYHNNFPVLYDHFVQSNGGTSSDSSILLKFIADPPTTTLQRLKGLTTGSLPTFIDAGSNFNGNVIEEDNLIKQFYENGKEVLFVGDDTWDALFHPFLSNNSEPFESLNVWDLDTVDNGVINFFRDNLINRNEKSHKWDVLIGHMLGVDHVGHKYGPNHFTMKDKQIQVTSFINEIISSLDDDTLLVVMGDHGMDHTGNHGGDSIDELESTLFLYSKRPNAFSESINVDDYSVTNMGKTYKQVNQVDIVPTLSYLLGTPIPFNSLGWPIEEIFNSENGKRSMMRAVLEQLDTYKDKMGIDLEDGFEFDGTKEHTTEQILNRAYLSGDFELAQKYQTKFLEICKNLWARFDYHSIATGVTLMTISTVLLLSVAKVIPSIVIDQMVPEFTPWIIIMTLVSTACFHGIYFVYHQPPFLNSILWSTLFGAAIGIIIGCCIPIFDRYSLGWIFIRFFQDLIADYWTCIGTLVVLMHALLFTSNSFTIWEDKIVSYLLTTFGMLTFYEFVFLPKRQSTTALLTAKISENEGTTSGVSSSVANSNSLPLSRFARLLGGYHSLVLLLCTRLASLITICRGEQGEYCTPTFTNITNYSNWCMILCFLIIFLIPACIKGYYNLTSSYQAAAPIWIDIFLKGILFINFIYWGLTAAENTVSDLDYDFTIIKFTIARIIAGFTLIAVNAGWLMGPLCIKLNVHNTDVKSHQATILGYTNIYGSEYFLLVINTLMALMLYNKPLAQVSIFLMCNQLLSILEIIDLLKLKENIIGPIILGLLSYQQFFSTGHQATIPSVQWDVGFILTDTITFPFTHIAILYNTFGPHILVALSVALLTLWNQPPDVLKPQTLLGRIVSNSGILLAYHSILCLSSFIWVTHFRRHLMVWKIFCPRFLFAALSLIVTQVVVTFGTVAFASSRLITHINNIFWG
ncbi:similar to Saccharomyces cerevisiae YLL031C GPI13 ER membrane localized phosphoryltransferase [Maudiozyma barnettii]|uniref:Similar to Saccharomyces cerevisiae YLL031C GPI13 ER membrane localized phosphoryltransferase n=1 Tax=Maudiozyma barnettii TaxID=61262 RepID=A0A8H2VD03_9SACH|nr:mannose-ethanolamine phosphotransferase GPI13 [Kazachstania barnettii]CAB4253003.1 similar to Saccharomyces cerevisiae YLL031C GPI13 ER membrane localized phosphoryltransferase [Kazachstania barnettii]CAD1780145.1 similar to Saccharomyces cerevisiae YLL031C GPI13 ER membrane localized phosphoryltransferase [Kazachstania barnettii]